MCVVDRRYKDQKVAKAARQHRKAEARAIHDRIKYAMRLKRMRPAGLARKLLITRQAMSLILNGRHKPCRMTILDIAFALRVHPKVLVPPESVASLGEIPAVFHLFKDHP